MENLRVEQNENWDPLKEDDDEEETNEDNPDVDNDQVIYPQIREREEDNEEDDEYVDPDQD